MKKILFLFFILSTGCTKQDNVDETQYLQTEEGQSTKDDDFVSKADAASVSNLFFSNLSIDTEESASGTKVSEANAQKTVKSIETLYNEGSTTPAMYVINYAGGGFAIISATKSYFPVLAYSDRNVLNAEDLGKINDGLTMWTAETKLAIKKSKTFPEETLSKMHVLWAEYETPKAPVSKKSTISSYTYDQYMKFYARMNELYPLCPGYSFGPLSSARIFLSEMEYNALVSQANMYGSPLECTIVGYKSKPIQEVGPLIGTQWSQGSSFNDLCENKYPAGCVAIAMGQIMWFYRFPASYNWTNMPSNYGTYSTQVLIRDIGDAVGMNYGADGSSSTNGRTEDGFKSMGYGVSRKNNNMDDVEHELLVRRRPVYMTGSRDRILGIPLHGHAWVCEGARKDDRTVNYFVEYLLTDGTYNSLGGPSLQSPRTSTGYEYLYYYQNWGWGGNGNGWYNATDVNTSQGDYQYGRENFYIYPN